MNLAKLSLAANALLALVLAAVIYRLYSTPLPAAAPAPAKAAKTVQAADTAQAPILAQGLAAGEGIYYVNTDSLLSRYTVFKKQKAALETRSKRFEQEVQSRVAKLEEELRGAQQRMQSGQLSQSQAQELEQEFQRKQMALGQYREEQAGKILEEEKKQSQKLNEDIQRFLKGFAARRGYRYILGYSLGGGILFASDSLDITDAVVAGLNGK